MTTAVHYSTLQCTAVYCNYLRGSPSQYWSWMEALWEGEDEVADEFRREHQTKGAFTDDHGILVTCAVQLLKVIIPPINVPILSGRYPAGQGVPLPVLRGAQLPGSGARPCHSLDRADPGASLPLPFASAGLQDTTAPDQLGELGTPGHFMSLIPEHMQGKVRLLLLPHMYFFAFYCIPSSFLLLFLSYSSHITSSQYYPRLLPLVGRPSTRPTTWSSTRRASRGPGAT